MPCLSFTFISTVYELQYSFDGYISIVFSVVSGLSVFYLVIRYQDIFLSASKLGIQRSHHRRIHNITFIINYNNKIRFSFVNIEFWSHGIDHFLYAPFTLRSCLRFTLLHFCVIRITFCIVCN